MKNTLLRLKNYRKERIKENEENKYFEDPTYHFKLLDKKIRSGYLNKEIPNTKTDKIKFLVKSYSGDSNTNTKRKLEHIDKTAYYQLGQNYDSISFDMVIEEIYRNEKRKALLYKISRSLFKLYIILFPVLFISHIINICYPTKNLNLFLTILTALFYFVFILWGITAINSSEINLKTTEWFKEYYRRKKNRTQELLIKAYEKTYGQLKHIKNLKIKINKNIIALINKQEADKRGTLDYHTPPLISSFFYVLFKNDSFKETSKINIRKSIYSIFNFGNYKFKALKRYFEDNDKTAVTRRSDLKILLKEAQNQIKNNFNAPKEINIKNVNIPEKVKLHVELLINELKNLGVEFKIGDEVIHCILEVFFTKLEKNERIIISDEEYSKNCKIAASKKIGHLIDNAI